MREISGRGVKMVLISGRRLGWVRDCLEKR